MYKPKYCCNCGERIERTDWKILSSRKFCELCETEFKFEEWMPKIAALFLMVFGVWGFSGLFLKSHDSLAVNNNSKAVGFQQNAERSLKTNNTQSENFEKQDISTSESVQKIPENSASQPNILPERNSASIKPAKDTQKTSDPPVYFCGAETKKGTPCSRHVKGGGRCWQHKGREAMLPAKDLLISEN